MIPVLSCSCLCPIHWSQVLSQEWRWSWSSTDRRCSNYIWVISNIIVYKGATYFRGLTASKPPGCGLILYYSILWDLIIYPFHRYLLVSNISSYLFIIICLFMIIKTEFQLRILDNILGLEYFCLHITTLRLFCLWNDICASTQNTWYQIILHYSLVVRSRALNNSI